MRDTAGTSQIAEFFPPWVYKRFVKEKLVVQERYFQKFNATQARDRICVIPDGTVWRKYLKLFVLMAEKYSSSLDFTLLESAVEVMDWRNSSPSVQISNSSEIRPEATAIQEKSKLRKLIESKNVTPFCDLSNREEDCDEFEIFDYPSLSIVERSKAALLRAGRMLGAKSEVLLLLQSEDLDSTRNGEGVKSMDLQRFLAYLSQTGIVSKDSLNEIKAVKVQCEEDYKKRNDIKLVNKAKTTDYLLTDDEVKKGLKDGSLAKGRLNVTSENVKEGFVSTSTGTFFVNQREGHFNRALHQDIVVIKLLPEPQWGCPVGKRRISHDIDAEDEFEESGPTVPSAIVVAITNQSRRIHVATLVDTPSSDERTVMVVPMDVRIPKIRVQFKNWRDYQNQRLLIEIDNWEINSSYPNGHCKRILGPVGDLETEIVCLLLEHEIQFKPFSIAATASLPPEGHLWHVPEEEIKTRRDLRMTRIFSVDPTGCQDIDDTMHIKTLSNGDIEVGVHIADVTYFVPHNSELDKEAQSRATTFYLVDRRFDMLPTLLSSDLCSLHGNTDRLAVSVIWTMSPDFEKKKSTWFGRTVIHNCQAMTYEQAHNILHDVPPDDPNKAQPPPLTAGYAVNQSSISALKEDLSMLTILARKLRKKREDLGGAVDLSSGDLGNELKFTLDENGNPTQVVAKNDLEIHHTIAELMILANRSIAEKIYENFPESSLLRAHRTVEQNKFDDLENSLKAAGITFDGSSNLSLAQTLKNAREKDKGNAIVNALWQSLATRAMSEALYLCTGQSKNEADLSHYGLGINKYTHFTSPIRRYADVVVHKQLLASLQNYIITPSTIPPPGFTSKLAPPAIPESSAISIMKGEGLKVDDDDKILTKSSALSLSSELIPELREEKKDREKPVIVATPSNILPYSGLEVTHICDNLNTQNRRAKQSSMACQKLFLSLFFKNNVKIAKAVITDLRVNGFIVFVPKFDMKGPVYIRDANGDIQMDPSVVGLPSTSGLDPTLGFTACPNYRRFSTGEVKLQDENVDNSKWSLQVHLPDATKKLEFRILDVITVQISCDLRETKARVPAPRLYMLSSSPQGEGRRTKEGRGVPDPVSSMICKDESKTRPACFSPPNTMYQQLTALSVSANLPVESDFPRKKKVEFQSNVCGRKIFADFSNPDTRSSQQEAAVAAASESAAKRRTITNQTQLKSSEFSTSQAIERTVTARTQRLAASKRNAKKSKSK